MEPTPSKKRKVSHKGARAKGTRGEQEFCQIMTELGFPTQRVVASGSHKHSGADSDTKIGVIPNPDGSFPPADETQGVMRGEVKNLASTPERYWDNLKDPDIDIVMTTRAGVEANWNHLNQSKSNRVVALRRAKVPSGAVSNKQYNEVFGIFMGVEFFAELLKKAFPDRVFHIPDSGIEAFQIPKSETAPQYCGPKCGLRRPDYVCACTRARDAENPKPRKSNNKKEV